MFSSFEDCKYNPRGKKKRREHPPSPPETHASLNPTAIELLSCFISGRILIRIRDYMPVPMWATEGSATVSQVLKPSGFEPGLSPGERIIRYAIRTIKSPLRGKK